MQRCAAITTEFENVPAAALRTLGAHRPVAPARRRGGGLPGPRRREGALRALRRALRAACRDRDRPQQLAAVDDRAAARHPEDRAPGLRRQGPGRAWRDRAELAAAWADAEQRALRAREAAAAGRRDQRDRRARRRRRRRAPPGAAEPAPRRHPRRDHGARARTCDAAAAAAGRSPRRAASPRRSTTSACCASSSSCCSDGSLVANEMAPRPHNSGHYTHRRLRPVAVRPAGAHADRRAAGRAAPALAAR